MKQFLLALALTIFTLPAWAQFGPGGSPGPQPAPYILPPPTASTLGGVTSATAPTNEFMTGINTSGLPTFAQPSFANLSGVASGVQGGTGINNGSNTIRFGSALDFTGIGVSSGNITLAATGSGVLFSTYAILEPMPTTAYGNPASGVAALIAQNDQYHDAILALRNTSVGTGAGGVPVGQCGGTAFGFADGPVGKGRAAFGYSNVATGCVGGFFPDYMFAEIGNYYPSPDADDTGFAVVNTHFAGATHLAGTSYKVFDIQGSTGDVFLNNNAGANIFHFVGANGASIFSGPLYALNNFSGGYPSVNSGLALGNNFSAANSEVDLWNTATGATTSFNWRQQTGSSASTSLMNLSPAGALSVASNLVTGPSGTVTASSGTLTIGGGSVPTYHPGIAYFNYNFGGTYPAVSDGLALGGNFSNANSEVDFWNTNTSATSSFNWRQQTGASASISLMNLSTAGALSLASGLTTGTNGTVTARAFSD
jgi:hypothetical protein